MVNRIRCTINWGYGKSVSLDTRWPPDVAIFMDVYYREDRGCEMYVYTTDRPQADPLYYTNTQVWPALNDILEDYIGKTEDDDEG